MNLKTALRPLPFMVLLFILPFPGTVVLRLTCLAAAFLIVVCALFFLPCFFNIPVIDRAMVALDKYGARFAFFAVDSAACNTRDNLPGYYLSAVSN